MIATVLKVNKLDPSFLIGTGEIPSLGSSGHFGKGKYFARIPLKKAATIVHGNALQIDWQELLNPVNTFDVIAKHANIYLAEEPTHVYDTLNVKTKSFDVKKIDNLFVITNYKQND